MLFNKRFVQEAIQDCIIEGDLRDKPPVGVIDSRLVTTGDMFFALPGNKVDGHSYIDEALSKGASVLVINYNKKSALPASKVLKNITVIMVPDTLKALVQLASAWRSLFTYPVIGITGSTGKTTTKEITRSILKHAKRNSCVGDGNFNTRIGLSLGLLAMRPEHSCAIFELGSNQRGEIAELTSLVRPTSAAITGLAHSHMEGLGSLQDIAVEKRSIFHCFKADNIAIINGDQNLLSQVSYPYPTIKFGLKTTNQVQARKTCIKDGGVRYILSMYGNRTRITCNAFHEGYVYNMLAAASIGHVLNIPHEAIVAGITELCIVPGRFEICAVNHGAGIMINDSYNANPESMKVALTAFDRMKGDSVRKIAVLGDMRELGIYASFWHRQIGRFLRKTPSVRDFILVGTDVKWIAQTLPVGTRVKHVGNWRDAVQAIEDLTAGQRMMVLVKGSRALGLDRIVASFTSDRAQPKSML